MKNLVYNLDRILVGYQCCFNRLPTITRLEIIKKLQNPNHHGLVHTLKIQHNRGY